MGTKKIVKTSDRGEIHICEPWHHGEYDEWKVNVKETEPEYSEDLKDLDWEATHRRWDGDYNCWTIDLSGFFVTLSHLSSRGYQVTFDDDVIRAYEENIVGHRMDGKESEI